MTDSKAIHVGDFPEEEERYNGSWGATTATASTFSIQGVVRPKTVRGLVLEEADELLHGDREKDYGSPKENFKRTADRLRISFPERAWTPADVARLMIDIKLGRAAQGYTRDTAVDIAGYAALWAELSEKE